MRVIHLIGHIPKEALNQWFCVKLDDEIIMNRGGIFAYFRYGISVQRTLLHIMQTHNRLGRRMTHFRGFNKNIFSFQFRNINTSCKHNRLGRKMTHFGGFNKNIFSFEFRKINMAKNIRQKFDIILKMLIFKNYYFKINILYKFKIHIYMANICYRFKTSQKKSNHIKGSSRII